MKRHAPDELEDAGPLFAHTKARTSDPRTSHEAAERVEEFAGRQQRVILHVLKRLPNGATSDELAAGSLGLTKVQIARRMGELRARGLVEETGKTRPTPSGRQAIVWRAT